MREARRCLLAIAGGDNLERWLVNALPVAGGCAGIPFINYLLRLSIRLECCVPALRLCRAICDVMRRKR